MKGDVTVVIPTRDRASLLSETLRSVREQTRPPLEIIVADDGSRDSTTEIVRTAGARHLLNPGGGWGPAGGRNAGLHEVRTPFVAFVDSDDLLLPNALAAMREALISAPAAPFAFGRAIIARHDEAGWVCRGLIAPVEGELENLPASLLARNYVPSSGVLVRTDDARAVGGFIPNPTHNEDFYFWLHLALRGSPVHVPAILSVYRIHGGNLWVASAGGDYDMIVALASRHGVLAPGLAAHLGGRLLEHVVDAARRRRGRSLADGFRTLLALSPDRGATLRAAASSFRRRRRLDRVGIEAWARQPQLRDWMSGFDGTGTADTESGTGSGGST